MQPDAKQVAPENIEWIHGLPTPPTPPVRPLHALISTIRLVRNKEDTRQVFEVLQALAGRSGKRLFKRFTSSAYGRRVVAAPVRLEEILSDRDMLRALPEGSLGRAYLAFMEGENLTPDGLLASAAEAGIDYHGETQFPEFRRMFLHVSVSHDLWHVLTGYGRDALGEACLVTFSYGQTGNLGFGFIGVAAAFEIRKGAKVPSRRAIFEAWRNGRRAEWLPAADYEALFALPIEVARAKLGIVSPKVYLSVPADVRSALTLQG